MDVPSINQLRELRDSVSKTLRTIKPSQYSGEKYGNENEYTAKGIIAGVDALTTDLSALLKTPARFIQLSTHAERAGLIQVFTNIQTYITAKNIGQLALIVDKAKSIMRVYGVRHSSERKEEFLTHVDDMQKKCESLSGYIDELKENKENGEELNLKINEIYEELSNKVENLTEKGLEIDALFTEAQEARDSSVDYLAADKKNTDLINSLLIESKSHNEIIDSFSKRIEKREAQLDAQEEKTNRYNALLGEHKLSQEEYLERANSLIESAKTALEYKTAEGLSAAFSEKYREAKDDKSTWWWLSASGVFVTLAIGVGIWIVWEKNLNLEAIVGRLSLLPVLLGGSWFCAGQYIKLKNIAEDYAYKSVLAKSIVGFSDQLASEAPKGEEYSHYIKSVLEEMHNDPLRKRTSRSSRLNITETDIKDLLQGLSEFKDWVKSK